MATLFPLVVIFGFVGFNNVQADTPANCSYQDILGKWVLHLGKSGYTNKIDCNEIVTPIQKLTLDLLFPDIVVDGFGNVGKWTMIYNQGFEIRLQGKRYFAFSRWRKEGSKTISMCSATFNGWVHDEVSTISPVFPPTNWGCYFGEKMSVESVGEKISKDDERLPPSVLNQPYVQNKDFIQQINNVQKSWKAVAYEEYNDFSIGDMIRRAGGKKMLQRNLPNIRSRPAAREHMQNADPMPASFDWRNVSGTNYVSPVRNQGKCGSCYAFSSMGMLEARMRILTANKQKPILSTQNIVSCSNYSQGCEGGFPYLIAGKYTEDFGSIAEDCYPYIALDSKCAPSKPQCSRQFGSNYYYVGGFYGGCNEELMKVELVKNGPVSISFMVYKDFFHYKSGIYYHTGLDEKFNPFEITNHAVLLVGYGVDEVSNEKYWIVKNSWGPKWGEQGYFRIKRGVDECAIESIAVAATPHLS
eukprot:gene5978-6674_t